MTDLRVWNLLNARELAIILTFGPESCVPRFMYQRQRRITEARAILESEYGVTMDERMAVSGELIREVA